MFPDFSREDHSSDGRIPVRKGQPMATTSTAPMTADDFYDWVHRPENAARSFELDRGEIIEMPPPGKYHGFVCGNIAGILRNFAVQRRRGYVCTNDAGILVERDPDTVRGPDVSFYDDAETADTMERKYPETPPPLVVEVLSPEDRINRVSVRVAQLQAHGVGLVWVVDPEVREVAVYRSGAIPTLVDAAGELTGGDVLPDLRCRVDEFFAMPGR